MNNLHTKPNRFHIGDDYSFTAHFGAMYAAIPMHHVQGAGHTEHIKLSFYGGLSIELTLPAATELARRLPEAIAALPTMPDCSGAVAEIGDSA